MSDVVFRHHTGRSMMDFDITLGPAVQPSGAIDSYILQSGKFQDCVKFQSGVVNGDPNGLSIEALLEVCAIRLRTLNEGKFENTHNHIAITKIEGAIDALKERALERAERGVLGTEKA
jgi:hypothetical protein